jgi:glycosyltransferase involved in cell wall biosynthesis
MTIVSPSQWLFKLCSNSLLLGRFTNICIPYGVSIDVFKPTDKEKARQALSLPIDKKIILFTADSLTDKRKGFAYLITALRMLEQGDTVLCTMGKGYVTTDLPVCNLGFIFDEHQIALVYSAADIFVITSVEDNLPNTVMESLACGTPVVGFDTGGIPDMVRNYETGLLAEAKNAFDLKEKIYWLLMHDKERTEMGINSRRIVEQEYMLTIQAAKYIELYRKVLA